MYAPHLDLIISCSTTSTNSLVLGMKEKNKTLMRTLVSLYIRNSDYKSYIKLETDRQAITRNSIIRKVFMRYRAISSAGLQFYCEISRTAFNVPQGVNCFDYNPHMNIIATGDVDLMVRLWNPYVKKPVGVC